VRGSPRAGAGKILPRPRRTSGGEGAGPTRPYARGHGGGAPAWTDLQVLIALVLVVSPYRREMRHPSLEVHPSGAEAGKCPAPRTRLERGTYRLGGRFAQGVNLRMPRSKVVRGARG
jgi:hypothetical protein